MSQPKAPAGATRSATPLLEVLLRIRQDMLARPQGPYAYMGTADAHWLATFVEGSCECLEALGTHEGSDALFGNWLRNVKRAWPGEGWATAYLREFNGDSVRAVRKSLDFVAEFRALPPQALASPPSTALGSTPRAGRLR